MLYLWSKPPKQKMSDTPQPHPEKIPHHPDPAFEAIVGQPEIRDLYTIAALRPTGSVAELKKVIEPEESHNPFFREALNLIGNGVRASTGFAKPLSPEAVSASAEIVALRHTIKTPDELFHLIETTELGVRHRHEPPTVKAPNSAHLTEHVAPEVIDLRDTPDPQKRLEAYEKICLFVLGDTYETYKQLHPKFSLDEILGFDNPTAEQE